MVKKSYRTDYRILLTLGVVTVTILLAMAGLDLFKEGSETQPPVRTTRSTNIEGMKAWLLLFERLGVDIKISERSLFEDTLKDKEVLYLINPIVPIQDGELSGISRWIEKGGVLVCTTPIPRLMEYLESGTSLRVDDSKESRRSNLEGTVSWIPVDSLSLPLVSDSTYLRFRTNNTLKIENEESSKEEDTVSPLLADTAGIRVAERKIGQGRLIVIADSSFLANGWIGKEDNAILAANLVSYALSVTSGNSITFDEYHLGYGSHQSGWTVMVSMLLRTSAGWAVLIMTAAALLWILYKGRRFGTRRALERKRRRTKMEFIHSVGATYREAGANKLTSHLIFFWFKGMCARLVGLPESTPSGEIAASLAQRTGGSISGYKDIFHECEEAVAGVKLSDKRFTALMNKLASVEMEIKDGNPARK